MNFSLKETQKIRILFFSKIIFLLFAYYFLTQVKLEVDMFILDLLLKLVITFIGIYIITSFVKSFLLFFYRKRMKYSLDQEDNVILGLTRVTSIISYIVFIFFVLYIIGVDLVLFLTSLSIFSVGIAIIFKEYITNFISGMVIMFSKDFKLKEYVRIGDMKGRIIDITFSNVEVKTDIGNIIFIPNNQFLVSEVINFSKSNVKRIDFDFTLGFHYYNKIDKLEKYVSQKLVEKFDGIINEDAILIKAKEIKQDETLFVVELLVTRYNFKIENEIKKYLSKQIIKFLYRNRKKK
ncbi:MAG: mechanosensitive ion channel domain-containing protein [Nanoarchaeota archaeon]|nr:mechanosensitive ion channel domain-containing protein [Nanoarchaeota archaeon]